MICLPLVDLAFEDCKRHLDRTNSYQTAIEPILTSYVSAVIYAEFERHVRHIVATRGAGDGSDHHLVNFTKNAAERLIRSIKVSDLKGISATFHADCKARFTDALDSEWQAAWDSIIQNRHGVAHGNDDVNSSSMSNLTFSELRRIYPLALKVLEALEDAVTRW